MSEAPDLTVKVLGYREWLIADGELLALYNENSWGCGPNLARCDSGAHPAPQKHCGCGLYGLHDVPEGWDGWGPYPHTQVVGAILAWGRIEVHPTGFRAEWAEPLALGVGSGFPKARTRRVERVAEDYGIAAVPVEKLTEFALQHGQPVPESLRPEEALKPSPSPRAAKGFVGSGGNFPLVATTTAATTGAVGATTPVFWYTPDDPPLFPPPDESEREPSD